MPSEKDPQAIAETRGGAAGFTRDQDNGFSRTPGDLPVGDKNVSPLPPTNGIGGMTVPEIAGGAIGNEMQSGPTSMPGKVMPDDAWCIQKALDIYTNSRNYMESNVTLNW